jgi:hypothetical protein
MPSGILENIVSGLGKHADRDTLVRHLVIKKGLVPNGSSRQRIAKKRKKGKEALQCLRIYFLHIKINGVYIQIYLEYG